MKLLILLTLSIYTLNASYQELLFNGNCVTCHQINNQNKSAPTIQEIQKNYKNAFPNKKQFVEYMSTWVYNPKIETSLMQEAIQKYGLMPDLAYDKQTLIEISKYIYDTNFSKINAIK